MTGDATAAEQRRLAAAGVHTLLVRFTDLEGVAKGKLIPLAQLAEGVASGAGFAGPSIVGTGLPRAGPRSEFYARVDLQRPPLPLPWWPGVALVVGDGFVAGQPFDACPRRILKQQTARLAKRGWTLKTGIEPEFFLLRRSSDGGWQPADEHDRLAKPSYDLKSLPRQAAFLHALRAALEAAGLTVLQLDHEDAHGQYEVNFAFDEAGASADALMFFKQAAHALAEVHGSVFSMMPKPFAGQPGSGMHFHVSLWDGTTNLFADPAQELSLLGRQFVAGVLAHSAGLCALAAPTVNSYKRLTVGPSISGTSWAPARVAHGSNNRTALVRTLPGRFEWRLADASANPYLATAGLVAAGLDGIERGLDPGPGTADDLFELDAAALHQRGIALLPQSLGQACDALEADPVLTAMLGETATREFLALKRVEATEHARHVSAWELERYAARF
jgi:glutamine synthetase